MFTGPYPSKINAARIIPIFSKVRFNILLTFRPRSVNYIPIALTKIS